MTTQNHTLIPLSFSDRLNELHRAYDSVEQILGSSELDGASSAARVLYVLNLQFESYVSDFNQYVSLLRNEKP